MSEQVAKRLQAYLDKVNEDMPPEHTVPWFLAIYRHPCTRARQSKNLAGKGVSTAIDLKERYLTLADIENDPSADTDFAIVYREGVCKRCGSTCRTDVGRIVETAERPPITGRVGRV